MLRDVLTNSIRLAVSAALGLLGAASSATAQTAEPRGGGAVGFNVDMNRTVGTGSGVPSASYGAASGQAGFWNNFIVGGASTISLSGLTGAPSGVSLTRVAGAGIQSGCPGGTIPLDFSRLMCDYDYAVAGVVNPVEYRFDNLLPGGYAVITYAGRADNAATFQTQLWINNTFVGQDNITGPVTGGTFTLGVTHTQRNVTISPGDSLRVIARDNSGEFGDPVSIAGIQLIRVADPIANIASPAPFACVCPPVTITGTASGAGFAGYFLEFSPTGGDPWSLIASGANPVVNGTLATWDPALPEGYYVLRLTVQNTSGGNSTAVLVVYLNSAMNPVSINAPGTSQVLGGTVCFDGTVWDQCGSTYVIEYRSSSGYLPVDPAMPSYPGQLINLGLGSWNTSSGPAAVSDGQYDVRVVGTNDCGDSANATRRIIIDNTPPTAEITSPRNCSAVSGSVTIRGTASDANLAGWAVQYVGGSTNQWTTINSDTRDVINGVLAEWDTSRLEPCCYAIRLIVTDQALVDCTPNSHLSEFVVLVDLSDGCTADFNGDGIVNSQDYFDFLVAFFSGCP
ncbi:MAG: hypothetical protein AB7G11_03370 [Phycisphaerales bacterium]